MQGIIHEGCKEIKFYYQLSPCDVFVITYLIKMACDFAGEDLTKDAEER